MQTFLSNYSIILLLSFLQVFLQKVIVIAFDETSGVTTAHFADPKRGRMSWIIDEIALPWTGQYYYIESTQSPMTNLLIVVDSSNGNHLGNCASYAPRDNKWRRFFWTLTEESLICNITDTETTISKIHFPSISSSRTFSLRILAQQGPKCFRDMIVQNEKLEGCPPKLQRNLFQGMSLECNCPVLTIDNNPAHKRNGIVPFHFVNPRITSSDGNLSISRDFSPGIPKNTSNLNLIKAITEIIPKITTTTTIATTTVDNSEIPITTKEFVNSPIDGEQNSELVPSIIQEPFISTVTHESLLSPSLSPDKERINKQVCTGIHCQNNGTCIAGTDGKAICICAEGFLGSQCEINLCANVECMHDGICRANGNVPRCQCRPGTTGTFCEQIICNPKCEQGGICELTGNVPICRCPTGTFGINCNIIDTCSSNNEACIEYDNDARCQLDSDNFALISPIPVNATFKCLCLNERSEWTDCKELPKKVHVPIMQTTIATAMSIPNSDTITSALLPETPKQLSSTQHIAPLFQNHPHFSNLFPNPLLLSSIRNMTTTASSSISPDADFRPPDESRMQTSSFAANRPIESLSELLPTIPEPSKPSLFDTTARIPMVSPLFITPKSPLRLHLFNMTTEFSKLETTTTQTVILSGHPESRDSVNSTGPLAEITFNLTGKNSENVPSKLNHENATIESSLSLPVVEFPATASPPGIMIGNISVIQLSTSSKFITAMPSTSISATTIIEDSNVAKIGPFASDKPETEKSTSISKTGTIAKEDNLSDQLISTTTSLSITPKIHEEEEREEETGWDWSQSFTKSIDEMETTMTTVEDFITESEQEFDEDEVKFVKLTVGLPTTTLIPDLNHPSDGAFSNSDDTTRSDTSSWTIVLAIIFALMVLVGACVTLAFRYVRRSRKLHGKYNPAREESILSSSYSMPMATVTKEERLI